VRERKVIYPKTTKQKSEQEKSFSKTVVEVERGRKIQNSKFSVFLTSAKSAREFVDFSLNRGRNE
jgi:hypothetical protein